MATSATLSDDWEEVDGDDFSVVSVSTSQDLNSDSLYRSQESVRSVNTLANVPVAWCSEHGRDTHIPVRTTSPDGIALTASEHHDDGVRDKLIQEDEVERLGMDTEDVVEPDAVEPEAAEPDQLHPQLLHEFSDLLLADPRYLAETHKSLISLTEEIIDVLGPEPGSGQLESHNIRTECRSLLAQLRCLGPILQGYAKHWYVIQRGKAAFPLDYGIGPWMSKLETELLALQSDLRNGIDQGTSNMHEGPHLDDATHYDDALAIFTGQVDGLMPMMQE